MKPHAKCLSDLIFSRNSAGSVGTGPHSAPNMGSRKNGTISDEPKPRQKENKGNENSDSLIDALISSKKEKERSKIPQLKTVITTEL